MFDGQKLGHPMISTRKILVNVDHHHSKSSWTHLLTPYLHEDWDLEQHLSFCKHLEYLEVLEGQSI